MESETEIQARLQRMVEEDPYGKEAETALRQLSIFLTEKFGGPAIKCLLPGDRHGQLEIIKTLQKWQFVHTSPRTDPRPNSNWRDDYLPWDNNYKYWLDPQVIQTFRSSPTDEERHFAFHAARILRFNAGISRKEVDFYLALIDWVLTHKPDIGLLFAREIASRYGGTDPRLYEKIYQAAEARQFIEEQVRDLYTLASLASRRKAISTAAEMFRQVIRLGNPETNPNVAYHHMRSLEYLGQLARSEKNWAQARDFYEKALALRESLTTEDGYTIRESSYAFQVWLRLCQITEILGDTAAHHMYGEKVRARKPGGLRYYLHPTPCEEAGRRQYMRQLEWHIQNRRGSADVLWHWGRFEYSCGHQAEGCHLCQIALLEFETRFSYAAWGPVHDINEYSLTQETQELLLKELRIGLADMGCRDVQTQ